MDADGPLMEQPTVPVVDLAPGWARRHCRATHDSFHFKNQQSSLDNHQSIPRDARGLEKNRGDRPSSRHLPLRPLRLCGETPEPGQRPGFFISEY